MDLDDGVFTVRRAFAKGRLKPYPKTVRSRRRVPLRAKVLVALDELPGRDGILFPTAEGGRINIDNFRSREGAGAQGRRAWSTDASTTCATRSPRGALPLA